ncbi:glutamine-tRNA ligase [Cryptococcus sp. DSM 104548]
MPPKFDPSAPENAQLISLFQNLGLANKSATELVRQPKSGKAFKSLIDQYNLGNERFDEKQAGALVRLSSVGDKLGEEQKGWLVQKIVKGDVKSPDQVAAALKFAEKNPDLAANEAAFDKECGVGINITLADLPELLKSYLASLPTPAESWSSLGPVLGSIKSGSSDLRWANAAEVKTSLEEIFTSLFGTKEAAAAANAAKPKAKPAKAAPPPKAAAAAVNPTDPSEPVIPTNIFSDGFLSEFHKVGENPQIDPKLKEKHLEWTKGKVHTRFPPEPNGFLHIGHVKAIMIDFGYAKYHGGRTYLRFDDTNPEAEEGRYFQSILESVRWLGFEPWKITYSSDNFDKLYELALELIRRGKAYVCTCDAEKIKEDRGMGKGNPVPCIHRERPSEESLREFIRMKDGEYEEKTACLRMKMDLSSGPATSGKSTPLMTLRTVSVIALKTLREYLVVKTSTDLRSHSLCTIEFIPARESYEWLCDALSVYKPRQYEFARLNLQGTFLSKRKIAKLVLNKHVLSWDDPRLYTIIALRRKGIPPGALLSFVSELGVTNIPSTTELKKFESVVRKHLEDSAPRLMMILNPIKVILDNVPDDYRHPVEVPVHPKIPAMGTFMTNFTKEVYIDADDFRTVDSPDYFRLAPGKSVGLFKAPFPVRATSFTTDPATGKVTEIHCHLENDSDFKKPQAYIQWVNVPDAVHIDQVRYFNPLFKSDPPPADFESDVSPDSLQIYEGAVVEPAFFEVARKQMADAREASVLRTKKALEQAAPSSSPASGSLETDASAPVPGSAAAAHSEDEPVATADQLIGPENIRFQGMRLAYFALDKESSVACLDDENVKGPKAGDRIVLNRIVSLKEDVGKKA